MKHILIFRYPTAEFYIYTGDVDVAAEEILQKVKNVMNIDIDKSIKFIYLTKRSYIEASKYPCFTLLGQAIGSMILGFEALQKMAPGKMKNIVRDIQGVKKRFKIII